MPDTSHAKAKAQQLQTQLFQMATAHWGSRLLFVAAKMGIADLLVKGPKTADELAGSTQSHALSLYRLMRTLAGLGLFTEDDAHRFSLTPLGSALRSGTPGRAIVLTLAGELYTKSVDQLHYSVQTGKTAFEKVFGAPLFAWLANHAPEASMFSETMVGIHGGETAAIAAAYDFSQFEMIVDVGGATGDLLAAILDRHTKPRGVLFDLPHVVRDAPSLIRGYGLSDRISTKSGNFFESIPAGGDAYLLSYVIHDWNETQCIAILDNCRRAIGSTGRLLIIETVLPSGNIPHPGKMLDIVMLAITGGQVRTEPEYRVLLDKAGFRLEQVVPTESAVSIVEASPI